MPYFNIVAASSESTVVAEYTPSTARTPTRARQSWKAS